MKAIKLEDWQLDNATMGLTGKGHSGKAKFQGSSQDFSEDYDRNRGKRSRGAGKQRKPKHPSVFQYLRNNGMKKTYITIKCKPYLSKSGQYIDTMLVKVNRFLFANQINKAYGKNLVSFFYGTADEDHFSTEFPALS